VSAGSTAPARVEGPSPALAVAVDLARRSLWLLPVAAIISALFWGVDGVISTLYALAIVVVNFLLAALLLAVGGRVNAAAMGAAALFGFLLRLGLIMVAVFVVRGASWLEPWPFGATLILSHLVLLWWETRHVSGALAFPGLKPGPTPNPHLPSSAGGPTDPRRPETSKEPTRP
jgi:hypothetical protein